MHLARLDSSRGHNANNKAKPTWKQVEIRMRLRIGRNSMEKLDYLISVSLLNRHAAI